MRRSLLTLACVGWLVGTASVSVAQQVPTIDVRRPTIVAFFPPVPQSVLVNDPDTNEALSDFQVYARALRPSLAKKGIDFQEVYTRSFKVKCGGAVTTFAPGDRVLGYYLIAPDRPPRVEYGVRTDTDLLQIANEYFAIEPQAAK